MASRVNDPTLHWLTLRIRIICGTILVVGSLLPPYIPKAVLAPPETEETQQYLLVEEGFLMKTSTLTRGGRRAYAEGTYHEVQEGDVLENLAERYGITVDTILWANDLQRGTPIQPGQNLLILPVDGVIHEVKRGQTIVRIAALYDIPVETIASQNEIEGGFITVGQELIIPGAKPLAPSQVAAPPQVTPPRPTPSKPGQPTTPVPKPPTTPSFAPDTVGVGTLLKPCASEDCFITQYFGAGHYGLDIQDKGGGPVYAAEAGTVIRADTGWNGGYGNVIEIDHGNGLVTLYGHNKAFDVEKGDSVERGQKIADMGNTGLVYGKTGIHVHFEVLVNGAKKNPLLYIQ